METAATVLILLLLIGVVAVPYWVRTSRRRREAEATLAKNTRAGLMHPPAMHPRIDLMACIGCGSCVRSCPEDVLGLVDGRAAIVSGIRCIGHGICADVCPVSAITLGFGAPGQGMEIPEYDGDFQTNVPGLYTVGELSGIGLIKNAVAHGIRAVDHIAGSGRRRPPGELDVVIIGAGPAGLAAALACRERGLRYLLLEQDEIGGTILHYPRRKLVLTAPVELPLYGKLKVSEISKEELLGMWTGIVRKFSLHIEVRQRVESVEPEGSGFVVRTHDRTMHCASVILALGRRGSPRKLGVPGEESPTVMYRLEDAGTYAGDRVLVVGGGDSAVEAAIGLASQKNTGVTLSYRREDFLRLKEKNDRRIRELAASGRVRVLFSSTVLEIRSGAVHVRQGGNVVHAIPNDFVFVFAGGELPWEFLRRSGIRMRASELEVRAA